MRRKDREITDFKQIKEVIAGCDICRIGFYDHRQAEVYVLPLNFGYEFKGEQLSLYFHGANAGRKIDLINQAPQIGFEMDTKFKLIEDELACEFSANYQSIIGNGCISLIEDIAEKNRTMQLIMEHYAPGKTWEFPEAMLSRTALFKIEVSKLSCKIHG